MERNEQLRRRRSLDFFMGFAFMGLGVFVALEGVKALGDKYLQTVPIVTNPGITTLVIGSLLAISGLSIGVIGLLGSGRPFAVAAEAIPEIMRTRGFKKGFVVLAEIAVYFFLLWNNMPFVVSTPIFLVTMMLTFKAGTWWKILLIAAVTTALTYYIFARLAVVPLPTEFIWERLARVRK
jgi:hypothetical protein